MKKTLSIILAILMIVTTIPMAFAADDASVASLTATDGTITYYATADEAFAAAKTAGSGTVTILADAVNTTFQMLASYHEIDLVVTSGKTLTLNAYLYFGGDVSGGGTITGDAYFATFSPSTLRECTISCDDMENGGTIFSGTFNGIVKNKGTIIDGTFNDQVINIGTVNGGTFNSDFYNYWKGMGEGTVNSTTVDSFKLGDKFTISNSYEMSDPFFGSYTESGTINCTAHIYQDATCRLCGEECSHEDTLVQVEAKAPTCCEIGWDAYEYCTACDYATTYEEKAALDHDIVIDAYVAPACTETGLTEGQHCSRCEDMTIAQEVIPDLGGHINEDGNTTCDRCGETILCEDCRRPVHDDTLVQNFVCWIIMLVNLIKSMF